MDDQTIQRSNQADFDALIAQFESMRHHQRIFWQVRHFRLGAVLIYHTSGIGSTELCNALDILSEFIHKQHKASAAVINLKYKGVRRKRAASLTIAPLQSRPRQDEDLKDTTMLFDQRITTTLLSLADSWENHSREKRDEAHETNDTTLADSLYGYCDGLELAARELRTIAKHLSKRNGLSE